VAGNPYNKLRTTRKTGNTDEPANLDTSMTEPTKRSYNATAARIDNTTKVAKHPPDLSRRQSIRPKRLPTQRQRQRIRQSRTAAKYPPASRTAAKHPPDDDQYNRRRCRRNERRQAQKRRFSEKSRRPPPAELPRRRLQGGSDATGAVVIRPTRSRLSPGKLTGEEGRGAKR